MTAKLKYIVFTASVLIGVVLRTLMLAFTVEQNSGFIKNQYLTTASIITTVLLLAAALVFFVFLLKNQSGTNKLKISNEFLGLVYLLMASAIFFEAFFSSLLSYATLIQVIAHKASALLSAAALLYMAACRILKIDFPKIITLLPVVFWITRVITVFSEFATLAAVSDSWIETVSMCLCLVVFLNFSKTECSVQIKNRTLMTSVSAVCAYFCVIGSVPRFILMVFMPSGFAYFQNIPALTSMAAAVFAASFALSKHE